MIRRLRELHEPILLFGESEYDAFVRLKKLEAEEPDFSKVNRVVGFLLQKISSC